MLNPTAELVLTVLIGGAVLFFAVKFGTIGGPGAGAERQKDPFNYWFGVSMTAALVVIALVVLILSATGFITK